MDAAELIASYNEWLIERVELQHRPTPVASSEWHASDDGAVELLHHFAAYLDH